MATHQSGGPCRRHRRAMGRRRLLGSEHLNVSGNTFRRLTYGVWRVAGFDRCQRHSTIVGNPVRSGDPTGNRARTAISPPAGGARAVYATERWPERHHVRQRLGQPQFRQRWNIRLTTTDSSSGHHLLPSIGENWYYQIKANLAFDSPSAAMVVRCQHYQAAQWSPPTTGLVIIDRVSAGGSCWSRRTPMPSRSIAHRSRAPGTFTDGRNQIVIQRLRRTVGQCYRGRHTRRLVQRDRQTKRWIQRHAQVPLVRPPRRAGWAVTSQP